MSCIACDVMMACLPVLLASVLLPLGGNCITSVHFTTLQPSNTSSALWYHDIVIYNIIDFIKMWLLFKGDYNAQCSSHSSSVIPGNCY